MKYTFPLLLAALLLTLVGCGKKPDPNANGGRGRLTIQEVH